MQSQNCRLFRHHLTDIYKVLNKPNKKPLYINTSSNHLPSVLKQIPKSVSKRNTSYSYNKHIFRKSAPFCISILQDCGFSENIDTVQKSRCH